MKLRALYVFITAVGLLAVGTFTMVITRIKIWNNTNKITLPLIYDIPKKYWVKLAEKKIFFGHQSVLSNIIEGINDIINKRKYIKLNIVRTDNPTDFDQPMFLHLSIGRKY